MWIAQLAPLAESVPPKLYGGTERVIAWLVDELVESGHDVTLFASGNSKTKGKLHAVWPRAPRLGRKGADPSAACALLIEAIAERKIDNGTNSRMSISKLSLGAMNRYAATTALTI